MKNEQVTKNLLIQGDVMLRRVKRPEGLVEAGKGSEILALGEISGHGHVAENCEVLTSGGNTRFLIPRGKESRLLHKHLNSDRPADHRELVLPELEPDEVLEVILQNEYNPFEKIMNQVID